MTDPTLIPFLIFAVPLGSVVLLMALACLAGLDIDGDDHE